MQAKRHWSRRSNQHRGKKAKRRKKEEKKTGGTAFVFSPPCLPLFRSVSRSPLRTQGELFPRSHHRVQRLTQCARKQRSSYHLKLLARKVARNRGRHFFFLSFSLLSFVQLGPALCPSLCELNALAVPFLSVLSVPTREKERARREWKRERASSLFRNARVKGEEEARKRKIRERLLFFLP